MTAAQPAEIVRDGLDLDALKHIRNRRLVAVAALAIGLGAVPAAAGAGGAAPRSAQAGTVSIGMSTTLSGSIASLGVGASQGAQLAVHDLNARGGVLGKKVKLIIKDDGATPATGSDNVKGMILNDHVAAILGPVSSGVAGAEMPLADQYKRPIPAL